VSLEIEFEYDDTQDGVWSQAAEADPRGRPRRRDRWRSVASPVLVQLGVALTALAVGAASTAGLLDGRRAQQDRSATALHLAPVAPFTVQVIQQPNAVPLAVLLATPWTNVFDQDVALAVINDGPDPVTMLGATVAAPEFRAATLTPTSRAVVAPGGTSVLRGKAHFVCSDFPAPKPGVDVAASPAFATIADINVRTSDGRVRRQTLLVDRYSDIAEQSVCGAMLGPQVVAETTYTPTPGFPGAYKVTMPIYNRAAFPLRMTLPSTAVQDWATGGGLNIQGPDSVMIPAHGSSTVVFAVNVASCVPALGAADSGYSFDTLVFTDGRDDPNSSQTRQENESLFLVDADVIKQYCGPPELPGIRSGSGH